MARPMRFQRPAPPCAECGAPVRGAFCSACGQRAEVLRQPVHHFLRESFTEFFGFDGRVWRTFAALLFRPGRLTRAYMGGQRQRYLRPLRVYLTSTLQFFLILSVIDPVGKLESPELGRDRMELVRAAALAAQADSVVAAGVAGQLLDGDAPLSDAADDSFEAGLAAGRRMATTAADSAELARPNRDSLAIAAADADSSDIARAMLTVRRARAELALLRSMPPDSLINPTDLQDVTAVLYPDTTTGINGPSWLLRSKAVRALSTGQTEASRRSALTDFLRASVGNIPTVMFLLLPLFAFLLKGLYARRGWFVAEHVVFGLHTHAFAFVTFTGVTLAAWGASKPIAKVIVLVLLVAIPLYFIVAMKRVYGQGWGKTLVKAWLLGIAYGTVLTFGLIAASLLAAVVG